jgi:hypothetical protein
MARKASARAVRRASPPRRRFATLLAASASASAASPVSTSARQVDGDDRRGEVIGSHQPFAGLQRPLVAFSASGWHSPDLPAKWYAGGPQRALDATWIHVTAVSSFASVCASASPLTLPSTAWASARSAGAGVIIHEAMTVMANWLRSGRDPGPRRNHPHHGGPR